ncbi:MAG: glycosyltransferase family 2 protein [Lachnospiraceae bacterium]|nr:glycosyltransferase family 2 protein [Lachnospiraceae bacterium]
MKAVVQVLLSSYNGEKYIREQLDSILAQKEVRIKLLVRDDGSTDGTREILESYRNAHKNITVLYGENAGVIKSFFALMEAAEEGASYTALSDQDDVWLPDKLARAVRLLKEKESKEEEQRSKTAREPGCRECKIPLAYCSAKQLVDAELKPLKQAIRYPEVRTEFGNALVENMCTGCTCVMNEQLIKLIKGRMPEFTVMHDFWIYLVGTCFGTIIYDEESRILYRQHGGNELGAAGSLFESYRRRVRYHKQHQEQFSRQAAEFLRIYGNEMPEKKRKLAEEFIKSKTDKRIRRKLLKGRKLFRQRKSDDWIFRMAFAVGKV